MLFALLTSLAWSADLAVDLQGLPLLGEPLYAGAEAGFSLSVQDDAGGRVRIRVAPTEAEAASWFAENQDRGRHGRSAPPLQVDEVAGDGHSFVIARQDNVAWLVQRPDGALDLALRIQERLVESDGWPKAPTVEVQSDRFRVTGDWAHVTWQPAVVAGSGTGQSLANHTIDLGSGWVSFRHPPTRLDITCWDGNGRAVELTWKAP